jgi:hypothetical protein
MNTQITTELFHSYPFTTAEAAKLLGVRPQHLASWRAANNSGFLPGTKEYFLILKYGEDYYNPR